MKKSLPVLLIFFAVFCGCSDFLKAQDTIHVHCFTFGNSQDSSIVFPSDTIRFRKILMNYKLKCNPAQNPACGQWDYLTYTYLYQPTGKFDSLEHLIPSYSVNGSSPDSFAFMNSPSYSYQSYFDRYIVHNNTISFDSAAIAPNSSQINHPFNEAIPACRSQYVWKSNELSAAGLSAGNITGLRFNFSAAGSPLRHLVIRMKNSSLDSITTAGYEQAGLTTVYDQTTSFSSTGWMSLQFTTAFNWNGTSNVVIDISYSNPEDGTSSVIAGSSSGFASGITSSGEDRNLFFEGNDNIDVPYHVFDDLDSAITISFWSNGNPAHQPQNQSIFEGTDASGQRVLNCHLPWGDGTIYWDAGNSGGSSYDRVSHAAASSDYAGNWVYWTLTKNVATGRLKIYKNGNLFTQSSNTMHKLMSGIRNFKIGSFANGTNFYDGNVDDFAIFNAEVDQATIQAWMYKKIDAAHPFYSHLLLYYDFDQPSLTTAFDSSNGGHNGGLSGIPASQLYQPQSAFKELNNTSDRPDLIFEQGVYNSVIDSIMLVDSTINSPVEITYYDTASNPPVISGIQVVYPAYYNHYLFNSSGHAIDSTFVNPDSTIHLVTAHLWDPPQEVINRFELGRYITPYGIGLDMGSGFTWVYDVTDYRTLLHDTVHLTAGNWQEFLDLSFDMIKGIPPRDPISVQNIYPGGDYTYGVASNPIESHFPPKNIYIDSAAANTRIKYRSTGHGEDGGNCDEFCPKQQSINVNGVQRFNELVWKDDCALNPLYPQGGTWIYQRANWCPGDDVPTYDYELTSYVTPGDSALLDVNFEPYTMTTSGSGNSTPHCVVESQLVEYRAPNFSLDAAIYNIKSPGMEQVYQRHNPICTNPLITIQNTGSTTLTSLDISYGQVGGTTSTYHWTGNLSFTEMQDVQLGNVTWDSPSHVFQVTVSRPNGGTDQYADNNTMTSVFHIPQRLDNALIFELNTNKRASEDSYTLKDDQGNVVWSRSGLSNLTTYSDTVHLANGCYEFRLTDAGEDGLDWWANQPPYVSGSQDAGAGSMKIRRASDGVVVENFNGDFGAEIYLQFTVGYTVGIPEIEASGGVSVYPNPAAGKINIVLNNSDALPVYIRIYDVAGHLVYSEKWKNTQRIYGIDLTSQPNGMYVTEISTGTKIYHSRFVLNR